MKRNFKLEHMIISCWELLRTRNESLSFLLLCSEDIAFLQLIMEIPFHFMTSFLPGFSIYRYLDSNGMKKFDRTLSFLVRLSFLP